MRLLIILTLVASPVWSDPVLDLTAAANAAFSGLPRVQRVSQIAGRCGANVETNATVAYCTSQNMIFYRPTADPAAAYQLAHIYGHAVQVRHGVADVALAQIRVRRSEEAMLRGLVTRQVECIAGFLMWRAGLPAASLTDWFDDEPFTGSHWGRDPLRIGPQVSIGLAARDEWFQLGQMGDLAICAPGEFGSDLLLQALRD